MARYYFDLHDSHGFYRDDVGEDFVSFEEARDQCQALLPDIAREEMPDGDQHTITCHVRDDTGCVVYRGELTYRGARFRHGGPEAPAPS